MDAYLQELVWLFAQVSLVVVPGWLLMGGAVYLDWRARKRWLP